MPILNAAAKEMHVEKVYYVDTRSNPEWKSNTDIDDYGLLVERAEAYLPLDDNDIPHLYTPLVLFVKEGDIVKDVSAPDYEAHEEAISEELAQELKEAYLEGFRLIS
jgi:hypothetical protein